MVTAMPSFDFDASKVDILHAEGNFDEVFLLISKAHATIANFERNNNVEVMWRFARACFDRQEASDDKNEKEKLIRQGLKLADEAICQDETHYAGHKWRAIFLSEIGNYIPLKEKIANSFQIREELDLALQIQPSDTTTLFALGKWCQAIASVGWMQRKIAATLFAKPPVATYEDAIGFFRRAFEIEPSKRSAFAMGECYSALAHTSECREWMQKCLDCSSVSAVERELDTKAKSFI